jgi:hypothetical protein
MFKLLQRAIKLRVISVFVMADLWFLLPISNETARLKFTVV